MKRSTKKLFKTYDKAITKAELLAMCFVGIAHSEHGNESYTQVIKELLKLLQGCNTKADYVLKEKRRKLRSKFTKVEKNSKRHGKRDRA